MSRPLVAVIPHQLGRRAARQRIETGMARIRAEVAAYATSIEDRWTEDRLDFIVRLLGQQLTGRLEVQDEAVRVEIDLPWILAALSGRIGTRIRQVGTLLLRKRA